VSTSIRGPSRQFQTNCRSVDVVVGVVPYVPTPALDVLPRHLQVESTLAYDGGLRGIDLLSRVLVDGLHFLKPGGALLVELGAARTLTEELTVPARLRGFHISRDEGDVRG